MKIENLVEKESVLEDDYLIVEGSDGTKKAKRKAVLDSSWKLIGTAKGITNTPTVEPSKVVNVSDYLDKAKEFLVLLRYGYSRDSSSYAISQLLIPNTGDQNHRGGHPTGYYYSNNTYASLSVHVSGDGRLIYSPISWFSIKDGGTDVEEDVTIYVYYR